MKYLIVWAISILLIQTVGRMLSYLIAALNGQGAAFTVTIPVLLVLLHAGLLLAWFKRV